jgi:hypothetical protein
MARRTALLTAVLCLVLAGATTALGSSNLLTNGSFSTGDFTGWTLFTTPSGNLGGDGYPFVSTFNPTGDGAAYAAGFNVGGGTPGNFQGGGVYQDFTVSTAGLYSLSFDWAAYSPSTECCQNGDGGQFSLILNGVTLDSYDTGTINIGQTIPGSLVVDTSLTPGSYQFEIQIARQFGNCGYNCTPEQFVTNASASLASSGATPEPGSLMLLGSGLVGLAGIVRRKRS